MADDLLIGPARDQSPEEVTRRIDATRTSLAMNAAALGRELMTSVGSSVEQIADKIDYQAENIGENLEHGITQIVTRFDGALVSIKSTLNPVTQTQKSPFTMLAIATGCGFFLARASQSRRRQLSSAAIPSRKVGLGPLAMVGLLGSFLRPVMVAAARDIALGKLQERLARRAGAASAATTSSEDPLYRRSDADYA